MGKRILMYKGNIISSIAILAILSLAVLFYTGVKEGYLNIFFLAMIIAPMVLLINSKNNLKVDLVFAVITISIMALYAIIFWRYKDGILFGKAHIMQLAEEARGQFAFENELKLYLLFICSSISASIALVIRFMYSKFKSS